MKVTTMQHAGMLLVFLLSVIMAGEALAQYDPCDIPPGYYRTQTQGGWGAVCHGHNAGCLRDANFAAAFPQGLTIGGGYTIHFTSSAAVADFLPAGSTPSVLTGNHTNPLTTEAGVFAGQVAALAISLGFSNAGVPGFGDLGSLLIRDPGTPFGGWSVNDVFALANAVLGGNLSVLPPGTDVSDLNDVIDAINNNFDDGTVSHGYLVETGCDEPLPVELTSFTASASGSSIIIEWQTASESAVSQYELARRAGVEDWQTISVLQGLGDNPMGHRYSFTDKEVMSRTSYCYRLSVREQDGSERTFSQTASATSGSSAMPREFTLYQNYPNPFNPSTLISFDLPERARVDLRVFDLLGHEISGLVNGELEAGHHTVSFDGGGLAAGVYLCRLESGSVSATQKLLLIK